MRMDDFTGNGFGCTESKITSINWQPSHDSALRRRTRAEWQADVFVVKWGGTYFGLRYWPAAEAKEVRFLGSTVGGERLGLELDWRDKK